MNKLLFFSTLIIIMFLFPPVNIAQANPDGTDLVISEVFYDPPNDSTQEWIELFNPTDHVISLKGWKLHDNTAFIDLSGSISSKDHFVVARNSAGFTNLYGYSPDMATDFALNNNGDYLKLYDSTGTEVDMVAWADAISGWDLYASNSTIRRRNSLDTDTVKDWVVSGSNNLGDPGFGSYPAPDLTKPSVSVLYPLNDTLFNQSFQFNLTITDESYLDSALLFINNTQKRDFYIPYHSKEVNLSYSFSKYNHNGFYNFSIEACDIEGNCALENGSFIFKLEKLSSSYSPTDSSFSNWISSSSSFLSDQNSSATAPGFDLFSVLALVLSFPLLRKIKNFCKQQR